MTVNFEKIVKDVFASLGADRGITFLLCGSIHNATIKSGETEVLRSIPTCKMVGLGKARRFIIQEFMDRHIFRCQLFKAIPTVLRVQIGKNIIKATGTVLNEEEEKRVLVRAFQGFDFITTAQLIINDLIEYNGKNSIPIVRPIKGDEMLEATCFAVNCILNGFYASSVIDAETASKALMLVLFNDDAKVNIEYVAGDRAALEKMQFDFIQLENPKEKDLVSFDTFITKYL